MPSIAGFQKHHIIPQQLAGHGAIKSAGMNIHKTGNIIYLPTDAQHHPTRTIHKGSHGQYTASVEQKLDMVHDYGRKNGWTKDQYSKAVDSVIADERKNLRSGKTMLNKNSVRGTTCG
jgi:hypothetical protein